MANRTLAELLGNPDLPAGLSQYAVADEQTMPAPEYTTPGEMVAPLVPPPPGPWQNPASSMAPGAIANAPRLMDGTLYEHGNQRPLQPNEIPAAQGYVDDFWRQYGSRGGMVWGSGDANDPTAGQPQQNGPGLWGAYGQRAIQGPFGGVAGLFNGNGPAGNTLQTGLQTGTWGWGGRNANRTLGELTNSLGTDSSYGERV